jgi:hypothetical protein
MQVKTESDGDCNEFEGIGQLGVIWTDKFKFFLCTNYE